MTDGISQLEHLRRWIAKPRVYWAISAFVFKLEYRRHRHLGVWPALKAGWRAFIEPPPF